MLTLAENEARLVLALRDLPSPVTDQVIAWVSHMRELSTGQRLEWSDSWSDEDLAEATEASLHRVNSRESSGE